MQSNIDSERCKNAMKEVSKRYRKDIERLRCAIDTVSKQVAIARGKLIETEIKHQHARIHFAEIKGEKEQLKMQLQDIIHQKELERSKRFSEILSAARSGGNFSTLMYASDGDSNFTSDEEEHEDAEKELRKEIDKALNRTKSTAEKGKINETPITDLILLQIRSLRTQQT